MKRRALCLLLPPTLWLIVFLALPAAVLCVAAFSDEGLRHLRDPLTWKLLGRSFRVASIATALCLLLGYPLAYFIAGCSPRWRNLLLFLVVLPFWTNLLVRTYALMFVLRPLGFLYTEAAVVFGLVHNFLPFMVLPLYVSIEKVPRRLLEASRDLGASPARTFWKVTVPLTLPGIAAGSILVFIPALGIFALPEFIGGASVALVGSQINLHIIKLHDDAAGSALTLVLLAITLALTWLYQRLRRTDGLV
jgi:spermidine/putrescine transport system permease protein